MVPARAGRPSGRDDRIPSAGRRQPVRHCRKNAPPRLRLPRVPARAAQVPPLVGRFTRKGVPCKKRFRIEGARCETVFLRVCPCKGKAPVRALVASSPLHTENTAFYPVFPLTESMTKAFCWLFLWNFKEKSINRFL